MLNIDPYTILWTLIDLLILYVLMKKFLFKPINRILEGRAKAVEDTQAQAKTEREAAQQLKSEYEQKLSDARSEAQQMIDQAKAQSEELYQKTLNDAKAQARRIVEEGSERCRHDREAMLSGLRQEVAALVTEAAAKVVSGDSVDDFLREEGQGR